MGGDEFCYLDDRQPAETRAGFGPDLEAQQSCPVWKDQNPDQCKYRYETYDKIIAGGEIFSAADR